MKENKIVHRNQHLSDIIITNKITYT